MTRRGAVKMDLEGTIVVVIGNVSIGAKVEKN